jgi:hypothetical protein
VPLRGSGTLSHGEAERENADSGQDQGSLGGGKPHRLPIDGAQTGCDLGLPCLAEAP